MTLGEIVKEYRAKNNLSLREFASKCGMSHSYIAMLENESNSKTGGPIIPTITTINKIARGMGKTIDALIAEADDMLVSLSKEKETINEKLTPDEYEILQLFRSLDEKGKEFMLSAGKAVRK